MLDRHGARRADVAVRDGVVVAVEPDLTGRVTLDAGGCWVTPGLVDIHVHLREPGGEDAETIATGARAASRGGFTAVVALANTTPCVDEVEVVHHVQRLAAGVACDVRTAAAVTRGRAGEELVDLPALHAAGVRLFTDDGDVIADAAVLRRALETIRTLPGAVLAEHPEDAALVAGGAVNAGAVATDLGVGGRPAVAEEVVVLRDAALARETGGRLHLQHLSTARAVAAVARAKAEGAPVTCEVTPHHLTLTEDDVARLGTLGKVNPPLRGAADRAALRAAGAVDAIATDHAPHTAAAKARPMPDAPPGMVGLETALGLVLTELVHPGVLTPLQALALLSWRPAAVAGVDGHGGPVEVGRPAHLTVIDPEARWTVDPADTASRSPTSPYAGRELVGRVRHTILGGEPVLVDGILRR